MTTMREILEAIDQAIAGAGPEDLCALVGGLVEREERARLRLRAPGQAAAAPLEERNLSAKEAARRLGVSLPYLYKHAGEYPFVRRFGKKVVFDSRGLEAWNRDQHPGLTSGRLEG